MSLLPASSSGEVSTGFYNGVATQSARFDANHYMTQSAPSSAGDRRQFTFSWWAKKSNAAEYATLYSNFLSGSNSNSTFFLVYLDGSASTVVAGGIDYAVVSTAKLRDITNWYHCVLVVDTDQSSNYNRMKIYINGILGSSMSGTCPQTDLPVNNTQAYQIGRRMINNDRYMDAYIADFHLIDGTAIGDTSRTNPTTGETEYVIDEFGEFKNGVWIPKAYTGSYGTNGFRLEFKQTGTSANSSGIGADTSGNTHHFTPVNMVASDSNIPDSPENNFPTFNPLQKDTTNSFANTTLSEGNLKSQNTAASNQYSEISFRLDTTNKYYFEYYNISNTGPYAPASFAIRDEENRTGNAIYFYITNNGTINVDNSNIGTGFPTLVAGDIMNIAFDGSSGKVWFGKNGTYYNSSGSESGSPADGTNPIATLTPATFLMHETFYQQGAIMNFGQDSSFAGNKTAQGNTDENGIGDFYYSVPSGFLAFCSANLPDPTIGPQTSTQADDHFNTVLYSGNSSNTHQRTGVGFQPDWLWIKARNQVASHYLADSSRGLGTGDSMRVLMTNGTIAEYTSENDQVRSFDADGFTLDDNTDNTWYVNRSSDTYVAWNWKANGGTTSSNSDGDITSTVQANTTAGFSIVLYTGNGTNNSDVTIGHGLGVAPAWVILKSRDSTSSSDWIVWHKNLSADATYTTDLLFFNSNAAENYYSDQFKSAQDTTFTIRTVDATNGRVNQNTKKYLAYCFAEIEGYSKFGKYTGNGSTDGTFVYTGFRPAWVLIKQTNGTGSWVIHDNKRSPFNVIDEDLFANLNSAESDNGVDKDFLSNGFKHRASHSAVNGNGSTYVYMAFAEQPFKFSNAR